MEIILNYMVGDIKTVGFQYQENINANTVVFEYIGSSIYNTAVFNSNKFFSVKNYDGRCLEMRTPLKVKSRKAEEQVTLASAFLVNTDGVSGDEVICIDRSNKNDAMRVEDVNLKRGVGVNCEANEGIIVEEERKIANVNKYLKSYTKSNHINLVPNNSITLSAPVRVVDDQIEYQISLANNSNRHKVNLFEQIRSVRIKNSNICDTGLLLSHININDTLVNSSVDVKKPINDTVESSYLNLKNTRTYDTNENEFVNARTHRKEIIQDVLNVPDRYALVKHTGETYYQKDLKVGTRNKLMYCGDIGILVDSPIKGTHVEDRRCSVSMPTGNLDVSSSSIYFGIESKEEYYLPDVLASKYNECHESKVLNTIKALDSNVKYAQYIDNEFITKTAIKGFKNSGVGNSTTGLEARNKNARIQISYTSLFGKEKDLYLNYQQSFTDKMVKEPKSSSDKESLSFAWKVGSEIYANKENIFAYDNPEDLTIYSQFKLESVKKEKDLTTLLHDVDIHRSGYDISNKFIHTWFSKVPGGMFFYDDLFAVKASKSMNDKYDNIFLARVGKNIEPIEEALMLNLNGKGTRIDCSSVAIDGLIKVMYIDDKGMFLKKDGVNVNIDNHYIDLYQSQASINIEEPNVILSKREHVVNIAKAMLRIDKGSAEATNDNCIVSIDSCQKDLNFNDYCKLIDGISVDIYVESSYDNRIAVNGIIRDTTLFTEITSVSDIVKSVNIYSNHASVDSIIKSFMELEQGMIVKDYKDITLYNTDALVDCKTIASCMIDSTMKTFDTGLLLNIYNSQERFNVTELIVNDGTGFLIDQRLKDLLYDEDMLNHFVSKEKINAMIPLMDVIVKDKALKDIVLNQGEWLYDNTPHSNLDLTAGGIDELLLPQVDFDYTLFKDGLVDAVTHKPINPVRILPDGSFIAKRPTSHPLPEYTDIAKDYLEVDVSLLKHLIETFYKIWQKNVFKFGAMDMRSSVAKMLEYMDAYVDFNIPSPLMAESKRVIRLIRWYGEASILKHAEYKIKYIYKPLKSCLDTGVCQIPNAMHNMFVDTKKYTITNNQINQDAWVEFEVDNPIDTKMSFMTYISNDGQLEVYINDSLESTYQLPVFNVDLELPQAISQKNKVKLFFKSINNGIINIANIVISDMEYSDIETEYSPTIGSGNKVLDDLVKRVSVYGDLYSNSQEFITNTINGNLAITDLVGKLNEYFFLHHDKKNKGKRKVTKK